MGMTQVRFLCNKVAFIGESDRTFVSATFIVENRVEFLIDIRFVTFPLDGSLLNHGINLTGFRRHDICTTANGIANLSDTTQIIFY